MWQPPSGQWGEDRQHGKERQREKEKKQNKRTTAWKGRCVCNIPLQIDHGPRDACWGVEGRKQLFCQLDSFHLKNLRYRHTEERNTLWTTRETKQSTQGDKKNQVSSREYINIYKINHTYKNVSTLENVSFFHYFYSVWKKNNYYTYTITIIT